MKPEKEIYSNQNNSIALLMKEPQYKGTFIVDNGSSSHIINSKKFFTKNNNNNHTVTNGNKIILYGSRK